MPKSHFRVDIAGDRVQAAALRLGWELTPADGPARVAARRTGAATRLVAELSELVAAAVAADWWLQRLELVEMGGQSSAVRATFIGGRRVATARATAASAAARRDVTGRRIGRKPSMSPETLDRIAHERDDKKMTYESIAAGLQRDGVPTPRGGKRWHASSVRVADQRRLRGGATG